MAVLAMDNADLAQEAARDVQELMRSCSEPVRKQILGVALEYGLKASVVEAWLVRKFGTIEDFDTWGTAVRKTVLDEHLKNAEFVEAQERKFNELGRIIDNMTDKEIAKFWLVQLSPWWKWIAKHHWEPAEEKAEALAFARARLLRREKMKQNRTAAS